MFVTDRLVATLIAASRAALPASFWARIQAALQDRVGIERLAADKARIRTAYLDLMRDSVIGRLNEDPPLPASKVDRYDDNVREQGWDWPSTAPSMIGAKRMDNIRSECERVITANVPGDFMETGYGAAAPASRCQPRAPAAGVRKAPWHEIAGSGAPAVPRSLWGFDHRVGLDEVGQERLPRSVFCKARMSTSG